MMQPTNLIIINTKKINKMKISSNATITKFTAIYDTKTMKNVGYSTIAKDLEHALKFFRSHISSPIKKVIHSSTWFLDPNGKDTVVYEA